VIQRFGGALCRERGHSLTSEQRRALRDLARCRTQALGGHLRRCVRCGRREIAYNSCRNRHCPKCHGSEQARWYARQKQGLLPCEYFHVVFTLPQEVNRLASLNPATVYDALFRAASETIRVIAADPKHLGAQVGTLFLLHTWGQTLQLHPHLHGIVTGGGLSCDASGKLDESPRWVSCRPGFFLPVRVLSRVYRGKFLSILEVAYRDGRLHGFADEGEFREVLRSLVRHEWVVYAKAPMAGPQVVLKYLARYTHRVAIANERLIGMDERTVTFAYKDYRQNSRARSMTLSGAEFLRRWVQHVLPRRFVKIRQYGLLSNRCREEKIDLCRRLLLAIATLAMLLSGGEVEPERRGRVCPCCGGREWIVERRFGPESPPLGWPRRAEWDSS
jgi:Putative transposase/Transposase zinc-binding domain